MGFFLFLLVPWLLLTQCGNGRKEDTVMVKRTLVAGGNKGTEKSFPLPETSVVQDPEVKSREESFLASLQSGAQSAESEEEEGKKAFLRALGMSIPPPPATANVTEKTRVAEPKEKEPLKKPETVDEWQLLAQVVRERQEAGKKPIPYNLATIPKEEVKPTPPVPAKRERKPFATTRDVDPRQYMWMTPDLRPSREPRHSHVAPPHVVVTSGPRYGGHTETADVPYVPGQSRMVHQAREEKTSWFRRMFHGGGSLELYVNKNVRPAVNSKGVPYGENTFRQTTEVDVDLYRYGNNKNRSRSYDPSRDYYGGR